MPLLEVTISNSVSSDKKKALLKGLSDSVAKAYKKPELYVAVQLIENAAIMFAGDADKPAGIARLGSVGGVNSKANSALTADVSALLKEHCGIDAARIHVVFHDVPASDWGYNGATLA